MFLENNNFDLNEYLSRTIEEFDISYIDAVVHFCEKNNLDIDVVANELKKNQKAISQIEIEAENLNFLPKKNRLDF